MASIHETAYPRIKPDLTKRELEEIYTPTENELAFSHKYARQSSARICLVILLKVVQRLGYFVNLTDVPKDIVQHICQSAGVKMPLKKQLRSYDKSGGRQRHIPKIRAYYAFHSFSKGGNKLCETVASRAAETKQDLADIINEVIEELVKQRYELPGYSTLLRTARTARNKVNAHCYQTLFKEMTGPTRLIIERLFVVDSDDNDSGWNKLKREPKKPNNKEVRRFLEHLRWLNEIADMMPSINDISVSRRKQYILEARSLNVASARELKISKRYALAIILIHSQRQKSLDDIADIFIRKIRVMLSAAKVKLEKYHQNQVQRSEKLVSQFLSLLDGFIQADNDADKLLAVDNVLKGKPELIQSECEEYLAYSGDNYMPFMLPSYKATRSLLFSCIECLSLSSTSSDQSLIRAIRFIFEHRSSHKEWVSIQADNDKAKKNKISLRWIPEKWRKLVTGKSGKTVIIPHVHRKYFELCTFNQIMRELDSADLVVLNSGKYSDFRKQLVDDDTYNAQINDYGQLVNLPVEPRPFVKYLKQWLVDIAEDVDKQFPANDYLELVEKGIIIRKHEKDEKPDGLDDVDSIIRERLAKISILDVLVEAESWLGLHTSFGPVSGLESKIDNPKKRFITTLFCYGCGLGPTQTARSVKGLSRKQVSWLNLKYITAERLDKAIFQVINSYNKLGLPLSWGSGKSVSVDGTKWNLYEQNLLSEYHIRYGGYGGIGYYHVSDKYIALFSHFIPCGVYEAVYILDGLINNMSDIQPDTVHGDTQAQSTPVFGLAYLLGINLMPRIRGINKLIFFKPDKGRKYENINSVFTDSINWDIIETHLPDMLKVALSIKAGMITPSTLLRRLGTSSRKNRLYFAFRELGRAVRTGFLLRYISDVELRKTVQAATNKSEEFNDFTKWLSFGNDGVIAENVRHEQHKIIKYNHLVANLTILHTVEGMTNILKDLKNEGFNITPGILAGLAPYRREHINRFGDYILDLDKKVRPLNYSTRILD